MKNYFNRDNKNLILFLVSLFFSEIAIYIFDIGIIIYLYKSTESSAILSGFFISQLLPAFIVLFTGATIDKYNKRHLMIFSKFARILLFILLLFSKEIIIIYFVSFMLNLLYEFDNNIVNALLPYMFSKEKLVKVSSIINIISSISVILGPLAASAIIITSNVNINIAINILLYLLSVGSFIFIILEKASFTGKSDVSPLKPKDKLKDIINFRGIVQDLNTRTTILYWALFMFFIGLTTPLEIIMIEKILQQPSEFYGIGNAVEGVGMLIASFIILGFSKKLKPYNIISIGLFLAGFGYLFIGLSSNIYVYIGGAFFVGLTAAFCPLGFRTSIQSYTNPKILGRTFALSRFIVIVFRMLGLVILSKLLLILPIKILYFSVSSVLLISAISYFILHKHRRYKINNEIA